MKKKGPFINTRRRKSEYYKSTEKTDKSYYWPTLNIKIKLTSIVSRHSFSTRLKRRGVSTEFIQESLGQSDKRTTEHHLDGFETEVKKEYAGKGRHKTSDNYLREYA